MFGTEVVDINAVDNDIGENQRIAYFFVNEGNTNEFGPFQINSDTGVITVVGSIDREAQSSYSVSSLFPQIIICNDGLL